MERITTEMQQHGYFTPMTWEDIQAMDNYPDDIFAAFSADNDEMVKLMFNGKCWSDLVPAGTSPHLKLFVLNPHLFLSFINHVQ